MTRNLNQKSTRTQITDLPEIAVELSEREMRVVSGGLASTAGCNSVASAGGSLMDTTQKLTNSDWDTDHTTFPSLLA